MKQTNKSPMKKGGLILGYSKNNKKIYFNANDTHALIIGATRSGKTRHIVLPTMAMLALSGENIVISDPKGEILHYTAPYLQSQGYKTPVLDFENPLKSNRFNFLQSVIDYAREGDNAKAIDAAWDVVSALVGESKGEKIWTNGECSMIACGVLCVVYDNMDNPQVQNLTNVYHFIGKMCTAISGKLPLEDYLKRMDDRHPAKALVDISNVAPSKTRGSFFTSALTTLRLFTNTYINYMTSTTDFDFYNKEAKKQALFIVLPDERSTYYSIATLFIAMHYQAQVKMAKENGGRLKRRLNYMLDEIGNFTKITDFNKMLTVGGGRGMRFNLFLQDFAQFDEIYGENLAEVIRNNCETWVYLQSDNQNTREEISKKLGSYTIKSMGMSYSGGGGNASASYSFTGRKLLEPDEIGMINRPYALVTSRARPAIMYLPGIEKTVFNELFGMGNKEHNVALTKSRLEARENHKINDSDTMLWGIWDRYIYGGADSGENMSNNYSTSVTSRAFTRKESKV